MFQNTEIQKSLCIETRRFCKAKLFIFSNLRVSIHGDSKISVYKTHKFLNLCVSIHRDSKISVYWNTEIQKLPCLINPDFFKTPITQWNWNRWWKYFRVWIRGLGTTNLWKNRVRKSHATVTPPCSPPPYLYFAYNTWLHLTVFHPHRIP